MENKKLELVAVSQEETDSELLEYERELRAEMERMLNYARNNGWCTEGDVNDWMVAFDDCEKIEYKENLVRIMAEKCLPSGEEQADESEEVVTSPYLSVAQRRAVAHEIETASVSDRKEIIKAKKREIEEKKRRYAMFSRLLLKIQIGSLRKQFEQKFADAGLAEAKRLIDELSERTEEKERLEVVTPDVREALNRVRQYMVKNNFSAARGLLNSVGVVLNFSGEYRELIQEIDWGEIELARASLKAA
ncbi:MAG: hypothetical protein WC553_01720 [Patescibacteria group bacterium]|jgi:hypothetical protein